MMRDFYPIGKVSPELTQRLVKQLSYSGMIEPNQKINHIFFENIVDKIPSDFSLTKSEKEYLNSKHSLKCIRRNNSDSQPIYIRTLCRS